MCRVWTSRAFKDGGDNTWIQIPNLNLSTDTPISLGKASGNTNGEYKGLICASQNTGYESFNLKIGLFLLVQHGLSYQMACGDVYLSKNEADNSYDGGMYNFVEEADFLIFGYIANNQLSD